MEDPEKEKGVTGTMEISFEREAMRGQPLPKGLDIADSCLYVALKYLYAMYKKGLITRTDAATEKQRLVYNWTTDKSKLEFLSREVLTLSKRISNAKEEYKNNPCIETADKLYAAFCNLPEDWRIKND